MATSKAVQAAKDVLERNRRHAMGFSQAAGQERLRELLNDAAKDLAKRLQQAEGLKGPGPDSFTAVQRRAALAQVQQVLRGLKGGLKDAILEHGLQAAEGAATGTANYLVQADKSFRGVGMQPLALNEALMLQAAQDGARGSILRRLGGDPEAGAQKGILERYGLETIGHFERELQKGFVAKKSWAEMRADITARSPFLQAAPAYWAARIVRTECANACNRGNWEAIKNADEQLGDMCKILSAVFDDRTGADSYAVHGQIRRPEEPFESWYGLYMHPPNRPNDREIVVAHRVSWVIPPYLEWVDDGKVLAAWTAEGHKEAMPPIPERTTIAREDFGKEPEEGTKAQEQVPEELDKPNVPVDEGAAEEGDVVPVVPADQGVAEEPLPLDQLPPEEEEPEDREDVILGTKLQDATGSNEGGVYRGTDDVERYVKFYKDPTQAQCEVIANNIYRDLGLGAPESEAFEHDGKVAFASTMLEAETLSGNLTEELAKEVLGGFAADVLLGNWDAVGLAMDNAVKTAQGGVARIDNGGSLLFRANKGRKTEAAQTDAKADWENFFKPNINSSYARVAQKAGIAKAEDFAAGPKGVKKQIEAILKLQKKSGGWGKYVEKVAPGMVPDDKAKIVKMLDARADFLKGKLQELKAPKPKPGAPITAEYGKRVVPPKPDTKNLAIREFEKLPTRKLPKKDLEVPPGGEQVAEYLNKVRRAMGGVVGEERLAVSNFTGGSYKVIRAAQRMTRDEYEKEIGKMGYEAAVRQGEALERVFGKVPAQPGQVFRGIRGLKDETMKKFMDEDVVHAEALTSTSRKAGVAMDFMGGVSRYNKDDNKVFFVIHQHSGIGVETHSQHEHEKEIILSSKASFRVLARHKAEEDPKCLIVECEEIKR